MRTYATRGARTKTTGHYRRPGTRTLYCGRPAGAPNDQFAGVKGWKLCARCVAKRDEVESARRAAPSPVAAVLVGLDIAPVTEEPALPAVVDAIEADLDTLDEDDEDDDEPTLPAVDNYTDRLARATWRDRWLGTMRGVQLALDDYRPADPGQQGELFAF